MIKLTLDTNCIINLLDNKSGSATSVDELAEIIRYGLEGDVNISITTRVDSDISNDKDAVRKSEMLKRVSMFPTVGTVFRLDVSRFDSGDVLAGESHQVLEDGLRGILFPGLKIEDPHHHNKINDIDHLIGHKINKRDIFVTDDRQILKKADTLKVSIGIVVMDPKNALEYINLHGNPSVLAKEFYERFVDFKAIVIEAAQNSANEDKLKNYEELRKWLIQKFPVIKDGLTDFRYKIVSVPMGENRMFRQNDLLEIQTFGKKMNAIFGERNPASVYQALQLQGDMYSEFHPEYDEIEMLVVFLELVEDSLLGYSGMLESK